MTKPFPYILKNNEIVSEDKADINLNHGGFLYGYGVFESVLIHHKTPSQFFLGSGVV